MTTRSRLVSCAGGTVRRVALCLSCIAAANLVTARHAALAQELEEVVVTAQKTSESEQRVPISLTAIRSDLLQRLNVDNVADLARLVPGLSVSSVGPGQYTTSIRGLASDPNLAASTVAYYVDETPVSAIDAGLFDLARVEVLRGPQGTLYGSSSMGGTIRYISARPDPSVLTLDTKGSVGLMNGGGTENEAGATLNLPLGPTTAGRFVVYHRQQDGFIDRFAIPGDDPLGVDLGDKLGSRVNSYSLTGARASVLATVAGSLEIRPTIFYQESKLGGQYTIDVPPAGFDDPLQARDYAEPRTDTVKVGNLTLDWHVTDKLDIVSASSYFQRRTVGTEDYSRIWATLFTPQPVIGLQQITPTTDKNFTQELRVHGDFEQWKITAGVYYAHQNHELVNENPLPPGYNSVPDLVTGPVDLLYHLDSTTLTKELSEFAELNWLLTQQLTATVGLRHYAFDQSVLSLADGFINGGPSTTSGSASASGLTPKFNLGYQINDQLLTYATASKGFRAGGPEPFNAPTTCAADIREELGLSSAPTQYKPDHVWNYEVGAKATTVDRRLTLDASVYYIAWTQVQQEIGLACGFPFRVNIGDAVSKGAELEASAAVTHALTLRATFSYTNATLSTNMPGVDEGQAGDPLINTPRYTGSISATFKTELSSRLNAVLTASDGYTGWEASTYDKSLFYYRRPGYSLLGAQAGVESADGSWRATLYGENLSNFRGDTGLYASDTATVIPTFTRLGLNAPRTAGLRFEYSFK